MRGILADSIQMLHPLNDEMLIRAYAIEPEYAVWRAFLFDTSLELTKMQDALAFVAKAPGPRRDFTRLRRSAKADTVPRYVRRRALPYSQPNIPPMWYEDDAYADVLHCIAQLATQPSVFTPFSRPTPFASISGQMGFRREKICPLTQ